MNRLILVAVLLSNCTVALAGAAYAGNVNILRLRLDSASQVYFGLNPQPQNTCSNWAESIKLDASTPDGKLLYSTLLAAKAASKEIAVWYNESTAPGTNESTGCTGDTIAVMTGIAIN